MYSNIHETNHVSRVHSVAAVLYLQLLQFTSNRLHGVTSQKRENFIVIAITKSNLTSCYLSTDYVEHYVKLPDISSKFCYVFTELYRKAYFLFYFTSLLFFRFEESTVAQCNILLLTEFFTILYYLTACILL
jgi:hypothetical protein